MEQLEVPLAVQPNFKVKIAAKVLGDKTGPAEQLEVPAAVKPNFRMKISAMKLGDMGAITPNKVSVKMLEVPEAFETPSGQNRCEPGRAEQTFREEFGPASNQEGGEHRCDDPIRKNDAAMKEFVARKNDATIN